MISMSFQLLGGIGLFLLGMVLLTDGLKSFAGEALQRALARFTGTPAKAFASGTLLTLAVQSSSATTVTLIGFVSAGLITFPQAVGVVMGASLGTTGTGWMVAVLGLKVSLGFYALPLVGVGALLQLFARGRWRAFGLALAGFGLIFVGIDTLQSGMQALAGMFDLASLPASGPLGYVVVMAIGMVMTVIMQSSSAAMATTLTALHSQVLVFDQAAALAIGAAVGTTVTGALAAIGGSVPAKRTAAAHVLFNLATACIAIALLPILLWIVSMAQRYAGVEAGAVSLALFHTLFIALGVAIFLPIAEPLARLIERLLPERGLRLTRHLDDSLLHAPSVALEASRRTLIETTVEAIDLLDPLLASGIGGIEPARRSGLLTAFEQTQRFFARIPAIGEDAPMSSSRVAQLHAIDHLSRLLQRIDLSTPIRQELAQPDLRIATEQCRQALGLARAGLLGRIDNGWIDQLGQRAIELAQLRQQERLDVLRQTAAGARNPHEALLSLDAIRWLERVTNHAWRLCHYLGLPGQTADPLRGDDVRSAVQG
jgi:phosphate:Na+ symporter